MILTAGSAPAVFFRSVQLRKCRLSSRINCKSINVTPRAIELLYPIHDIQSISLMVLFIQNPAPPVALRSNLILDCSQIIQIGRMNVLLSMAESSSRKHRIAPAPLGTDPLSSTLNADASSVPGFVLFLISSG